MKYTIQPAYVNGKRVPASAVKPLSALPDCVWDEALSFAEWVGQDVLVTDEEGWEWIL